MDIKIHYIIMYHYISLRYIVSLYITLTFFNFCFQFLIRLIYFCSHYFYCIKQCYNFKRYRNLTSSNITITSLTIICYSLGVLMKHINVISPVTFFSNILYFYFLQYSTFSLSFIPTGFVDSDKFKQTLYKISMIKSFHTLLSHESISCRDDQLIVDSFGYVSLATFH